MHLLVSFSIFRWCRTFLSNFVPPFLFSVRLSVFIPGSLCADVLPGLDSGFGGTSFVDNLADDPMVSYFVALDPSLPSVFPGDFLWGIQTMFVMAAAKQ